jgi:hypothetical protein
MAVMYFPNRHGLAFMLATLSRGPFRLPRPIDLALSYAFIEKAAREAPHVPSIELCYGKTFSRLLEVGFSFPSNAFENIHLCRVPVFRVCKRSHEGLFITGS